MTKSERILKVNLQTSLAERLDEVAARNERTRSWIVREALREWLTEEERRHRLTLEALEQVDQGQMLTHEEVMARVEETKRRARKSKS